MREIRIEGFTDNTHPDNKPAVCVYGLENVGKTRFGCTAPCTEGVVGYMSLDVNSKRTVDEYHSRNGMKVVVNTKPLMTDKDAIRIARLDASIADQLAEVRNLYGDVVNRVFEHATRLVESADVESIVIDTASQLNDWITFSHFGRKSQIKPTSRAAANQDFIDFINMLRPKNTVLIHRSSEIWKDTGVKDKEGLMIQAPCGKFKPDGFRGIGGYVTAVCEMTAERIPNQSLEQKYRLRVMTCKGNTLMEGQDLHEYGVSGEAITWDNLMLAIGLGA